METMPFGFSGSAVNDGAPVACNAPKTFWISLGKLLVSTVLLLTCAVTISVVKAIKVSLSSGNCGSVKSEVRQALDGQLLYVEYTLLSVYLYTQRTVFKLKVP